LLSDRHYSIDQLADIFQIDRDRVSKWVDWWEEFHLDGLDDDPRCGRPPKPKEQKQVLKTFFEESRSMKQGSNEIGKSSTGAPF
jgi:transposase